MEKKYVLTKETKRVNGKLLHRIKAIRDFNNAKEGDLGGFIETEDNLSHEGNCWVDDEAKVFGNARVYDNAVVYDNAMVFGNARVYGNAYVNGNARVYENAYVYGGTFVNGNAHVYGNAAVYGKARVCGQAIVRFDAKVSSIADYIVFKNWWSSGRHFTWTRSNDKWLVGCFYGSGEELVAKAYKDSELSGREYQRVVEYVESIKKAKC